MEENFVQSEEYRRACEAQLAQDFWFMCRERPNEFEEVEDWADLCECMEWNNGWLFEFYNLCRQLLTEVKSDFHWTQLKEKYGTANCYYTGGITKYGQELIEQFEKDSAEICEWCGKPGKIRDVGNWYVTLCDDCLDKYNKKY